MQLPLHPPRGPSQEYTIFALLQNEFSKKLSHEYVYNSWMSEETWRVIDARVSLWISQYIYQRRLRELGRRAGLLLDGDRKRRAVKPGTAVDYLLASETTLIKEIWCWIWGWYKMAINRLPTPSRVTI